MSNSSGQAYALMTMTPIVAGREAQLRAHLEGFDQQSSPFVSLAQTHFARWVILPDWVNDPAQPRQDHLHSEYLIFTSNFDGPLEVYLEGLCALPQAGEIWGHCVGAPAPASGHALMAYLLHSQIDIGFFVAAYPDASVAQVRASLSARERLMGFAVRSQGMDPQALQSAFRAEFGS